jgi:hypothetical protein
MFAGFTNCKTCQRVIVPDFLPPFDFFMHSALTPYIKSNQISNNGAFTHFAFTRFSSPIS